jgi:hypothetical protein
MTDVLATPELTPHFTQRVDLDGVSYLLELQWIQRESRWYFRLATEQDITIVGLQKLVVDWDLLRNCVDARRPPGRLFALDTTGVGTHPSFDDIGERVLVCYTPEVEL